MKDNNYFGKWFRDKLFNCTVLKKEKYFDKMRLTKLLQHIETSHLNL